MSTLMDTVAGKGRSLSTNAWIALLVGSLVVFAGNTLYATTKASRLGSARTAAADPWVSSRAPRGAAGPPARVSASSASVSVSMRLWSEMFMPSP